MNGSLEPSVQRFPTLCRTCVYLRFLAPPLGRDDEPRLLGGTRSGHSEDPCRHCSCNPRLSLFYASIGRTRRLNTTPRLVRVQREF